MELTKQLHKELRDKAATALCDARRFKGITELHHWYEGKYRAYKHSARLLEIALYHDKWLQEIRETV